MLLLLLLLHVYGGTCCCSFPAETGHTAKKYVFAWLSLNALGAACTNNNNSSSSSSGSTAATVLPLLRPAAANPQSYNLLVYLGLRV